RFCRLTLIMASTEVKTMGERVVVMMGEIKRLIDENKDANIYIMGDSMWSYYWGPKHERTEWCEEEFPEMYATRFTPIGYGYDRDLGSCTLFVNNYNGKIWATYQFN